MAKVLTFHLLHASGIKICQRLFIKTQNYTKREPSFFCCYWIVWRLAIHLAMALAWVVCISNNNYSLARSSSSQEEARSVITEGANWVLVMPPPPQKKILKSRSSEMLFLGMSSKIPIFFNWDWLFQLNRCSFDCNVKIYTRQVPCLLLAMTWSWKPLWYENGNRMINNLTYLVNSYILILV